MAKIFVASVTAFDEQNKIDEYIQRQLMDRNISEGADGFFIGGSSAECFLLSEKERIQCLELAYGFADRTKLIAHIGAINTKDAITLAKEAKRIGYTELAATPPLYFGYKQSEISNYYREISKAVDLPIMYYNISMNTGKILDLRDESTLGLLQSGIISSIKHTDYDIYSAERIASVNKDIVIHGGLEQNMLAFKAIGCNSFIGSTFNFMLPHYREIDRLSTEGKPEEALRKQIKANNIMNVIWDIGLFPSIKYILRKQGINVGKARSPFQEVNEKEKKIIDKVLTENLFVGSSYGEKNNDYIHPVK